MNGQNKKIAIISSEKFAGKINEDILLQKAFRQKEILADIVAWENTSINWQQYSGAVLRSAWGYHNKLDDFEKFLTTLNNNNVIMINDTNVIRWNIHKDKQFNYLSEAGVDIVPTYFAQNGVHDLQHILKNIAQKNGCSNFVIKPSVSGSGENTHLVCLDASDKKIKNQLTLTEAEEKFNDLFKRRTIRSLMIQPYIKGISNGEYSFVFIDAQLSHVGIRFPGIFLDKQKTKEVDSNQLPLELPAFANKCFTAINNLAIKIGQKQQTLSYLRCDIVKNNNQYLLMEAEAAEPDLLIKYIHSEQKRKAIALKLAQSVLNRVYKK